MLRFLIRCAGLLLGLFLAVIAPGMRQPQAQSSKPTIVELINLLKPGSLTNEKGKWVQTWVDDPGFEGVNPTTVEIPNGFASFVDSGTGAGGISHEFAVYYTEGAGAILVHNFEDDRDTYKSNLKCYQVRAGKLVQADPILPKVTCREMASERTIRVFYKNPRLDGAAADPLLPTYALPRKGTTIVASCDTTRNRFNIFRP